MHTPVARFIRDLLRVFESIISETILLIHFMIILLPGRFLLNRYLIPRLELNKTFGDAAFSPLRKTYIVSS